MLQMEAVMTLLLVDVLLTSARDVTSNDTVAASIDLCHSSGTLLHQHKLHRLVTETDSSQRSMATVLHVRDMLQPGASPGQKMWGGYAWRVRGVRGPGEEQCF